MELLLKKYLIVIVIGICSSFIGILLAIVGYFAKSLINNVKQGNNLLVSLDKAMAIMSVRQELADKIIDSLSRELNDCTNAVKKVDDKVNNLENIMDN